MPQCPHTPHTKHTRYACVSTILIPMFVGSCVLRTNVLSSILITVIVMDSEDSSSRDAHEAAREPVLKVLHELEDQFLMPRYGSDSEEPYDPPSANELIAIYGHGTPEFSFDEAYLKMEKAVARLVSVWGWAETDYNSELSAHLINLIKSIQESYSLLVAYTSYLGKPASVMGFEDFILRTIRGSDQKETSIYTVYKYILASCYRMNVSHQGDTVLKEIKTPEGVATNAWEPARAHLGFDMSTLELLVARICTASNNAAIYEQFIGVPTESIVKKLKICIEPQFPVLIRSREWVAFKDGLYHVNTDTFILHGVSGLPTGTAACKYHNELFAPVMVDIDPEFTIQNFKDALSAIKTPKLDSLLATQHFDDTTQFWLLASLGKALYNNRQFDDWEVASFYRGLANTGKTSLIEVIEAIYDESDIALIQNNVEATFGLMNVKRETFVIVAGEIKSDFKMDQGQFQQLTSGERTGIQRKYLGSLQEKFDAPLMLAGNTSPLRWTDNSGSLARRMLMFYFGFSPAKTDTTVKAHLATIELPAILRKINLCYRKACDLVGTSNLWDSGLLSQHILDQRTYVFTTLNPLCEFVVNGDFQFGPKYWCPLREFMDSFKAHCQRLSKYTPQWTEDVYDTVFKERNIVLKKAVYTWGEDKRQKGTIVVGLVKGAEMDCMVNLGQTKNPDYNC